MPVATRTETHSRESSFVNILSGWTQQGVQTFFATQRILLDLAMRQNAKLMHTVREQFSNPQHSPSVILSEVAEEGIANFIEGQKILLELGKQQNEILLSGVKDQVGDYPAAEAITDLMRRSVETFIHMQQEFLKIAEKQTHTFVEAAQTGKPFQPAHLVELAREGMDNFVKTQKQFLDVVAAETAKATSGKHIKSAKKTKKTELAEIARQTTEAFIEAQKKLVNVAGQQMNAGVKTAGKAVEILRPFPFLPLAELTREGVKSYVDAQKALMEVISKPSSGREHPAKAEHQGKRLARAKRAAAGSAA